VSIIAEVKCARCDRKYSGVRSRCPYCGARRIGRGKYSEENDDSKGKMLVGILILAVLVVAVVVLLLTTDKPEDSSLAAGSETGEPTSDMSGSGLPGEDDITSMPGPSMDDPSTTPTTSETPAESPTATVQSVIITYANLKKTDFTEHIGIKVPLKAKVEPPGIDVDIEWSSSNTDIFEVVPKDVNGNAADVIGKAKGDATLTVRVGDVEATCIVRIIP